MAARSYNLKAGDHPLVRITLQPPLEALLQPGGTLGGVLDFRCTYDGGDGGSRAERPACLQVRARARAPRPSALPPLRPSLGPGQPGARAWPRAAAACGHGP
jgi:hypothetical protein